MAYQDISDIRIISAYDLQEFLADIVKAVKDGYEYDPEQPKGYPAQIGSYLAIEVYKKGSKLAKEVNNTPSEFKVASESLVATSLTETEQVTKGKPGRKAKVD